MTCSPASRATELRNEATVRRSQTLTTYARRNPDTIRGRLSPVIVYDPIIGRQSFGGAMRALIRAHECS